MFVFLWLHSSLTISRATHTAADDIVLFFFIPVNGIYFYSLIMWILYQWFLASTFSELFLKFLTWHKVQPAESM